jgi:uncharacterized membrane protein HdeD (DUF308 family)
MKFFLKNLGIFLVFLGALLLIVPFFTRLQTNQSLLWGWIFIVAGFICYIFINKKIR